MNEKAKNILYYAVIIVLAAVLSVLLFVDNQRSARIAEENEKSAMKQGAENKRLRAAGEEIYDQLLLSLESAPKGFVLWGDAQALGGRSGRLSLGLSNMIENAFFSQLMADFSNIGRMYNVSEIVIDVANMGVVNESLNEIMARTGTRQMVLGEDFDMPADTSGANIILKDEDGNTLRFASQTNAKFGEARIDGVAGKLYEGEHYDSLHFQLAFERNAEGKGYTVPAGTPVETEGASKYRSYCPVLFFPEYDGVTADAFVLLVQDFIALYGDHTHYIVVCVTEEGSEWDQALLQAFGNQYILVEKTAEDMTENDCDVLAAHVFSVLSSQGAFDEVKIAVDEAHEKLRQLNAGD